jgi:hypothetical protein
MDGLLATGLPFGTPQFVSAHAHGCANMARGLIDILNELTLPAQDHWLLLHGCLQQRTAHLLRGAEWDAVGPAVTAVEDRVLVSAFTVMDRAWRDAAIQEQMTLPQRHGGLGLQCTSRRG